VPPLKPPNNQNPPREGFPKPVRKAVVYEALAAFNRDVEGLLVDLERLGALGLFRRRWQRQFLKAARAALEETRAWTNFELLEVLHAREEAEWVHFARLRQRAEQPTENPGDPLPPAEPRMRKSRKGRRP
jgi:hypothetical protein